MLLPTVTAPCQNNFPIQNRPILLTHTHKKIVLQTKMFKDIRDAPRHQDLRGQYSRKKAKHRGENDLLCHMSSQNICLLVSGMELRNQAENSSPEV